MPNAADMGRGLDPELFEDFGDLLLLLPGDLLPYFMLSVSFDETNAAPFFSIFAAALCVLAPRLSVAYEALDDASDSLDVIYPLFFAREE